MSRTSAMVLACLIPGLLLAACGGRKADDEAPARSGDGAVAREAVLPSPFAFDVDVVLSDAAARRLGESRESVIVAAMYYAGGKAGIAPDVLDDIGLVDIGRAQIELAGQGRASFDGSAVLRERLEFIEGAPQVNVNVYSGRRSSPDNLLDCGMFQDTVRVAIANPVRIACRLIEE